MRHLVGTLSILVLYAWSGIALWWIFYWGFWARNHGHLDTLKEQTARSAAAILGVALITLGAIWGNQR